MPGWPELEQCVALGFAHSSLIMRAASLALALLVSAALSERPLLHRITGTVSMNETLRQAASRIPHFAIGSQNNVHHVTSEPNYTRTLRAQYEVSVAENSCKWGATETAKATFNFSQCHADQAAIVDQFGMKFRLHNLCCETIKMQRAPARRKSRPNRAQETDRPGCRSRFAQGEATTPAGSPGAGSPPGSSRTSLLGTSTRPCRPWARKPLSLMS